MEKIIKHFSQSGNCQELYVLRVMSKVSESDGSVSLEKLKDDMYDFHYDRIENGFIHGTMRGQFLTLMNKIRDLDSRGWERR